MGNLKDMDTILAEMGAKWKTISKDQQVALAQTVAGTRQYSQLMALMNNFDFYEENINRANNADGTLTKQQKIYEESWAAASKRVKASIEDIYSSLIDDEFFIKLTNGFSKFLDLINNTIDGLGGLKGVLLFIGTLTTKIFSENLSAGIASMATSLKSITSTGKQAVIDEHFKVKQDANDALRNQQDNELQTMVNNQTADVYDSVLTKSKELLTNNTSLTESEDRRKNILLDEVEVLGRQVTMTRELADQQRAAVETRKRQFDASLFGLDNADELRQKDAEAKQSAFNSGVARNLRTRVKNSKTGDSDGGETYNKFIKEIKEKAQPALNRDKNKPIKDWTKEEQEAEAYLNILNAIKEKMDELKKQGSGKTLGLNDLDDLLEQVDNRALDETEKKTAEVQEALDAAGRGKLGEHLVDDNVAWDVYGQNVDRVTGSVDNFSNAARKANEEIFKMQGKPVTISDGMVALSQSVMSAGMAISSLVSLVNIWNNEDMSAGEKLLTTMTTLGMVVPMVVSAFSKQNLVQMKTLSGAIALKLGLVTVNAEEAKQAGVSVAAAAGNELLGKSFWSLLGPIGLVMLAIGALVGTISLLVMAYQDVERQSPEHKLQDVNAAVEDLNEEISNTKQETQDLINTINEIDSGYDKIAKMTKGQQGFAEAVAETNEQVLELLDKYPELSQYLTRDTDTNLLKISQKGFDYVTSQQYIKEGGQQYAKSELSKRQGELTLEQFNKEWEGVQYSSGGNYADKLKSAAKKEYSDIISMTNDELNAIVDDNKDLLTEILYHQFGLSNVTDYYDSKKLPEGWQDQVRSDAREMASAESKINNDTQQKAIFQSTLTKMAGNSLRVQNYDSTKEYEKVKQKAENAANNFDNDWNDRRDYDSGDTGQWDKIQKVVQSYGSNASYVAQRRGEMVINIDGTEKKLTEEQFKNKLQEIIYDEEVQNLETDITNLVSNSLRDSSISQGLLDKMSTEQQASLDNVKYSLSSILGDETGNKVFTDMVDQFQNINIDEKGNEAVTALNAMTEAFNNTDWSQGEAAVESYKEKLDALGITMYNYNTENLEKYAGAFQDAAKIMQSSRDYNKELNTSIEEQAAEVGLSTTAMDEYVDQLKTVTKYQDLTDKQLKKAAIQQKKARKALDELAESWDKVTKAIRENDVMSEDYEEGIAALKKAYSSLFKLDVSDEFIKDTKNLDLMEQALKGNQEAFDELSKLVGQDWLINLDFTETELDTGEILNVDGFRSTISEIENLIQNADLTVDTGLDDEMINTLNEYVRAGKVTVDELNGYFGQVHGIEFDTELQYLEPEEAVKAASNSSSVMVTENTIERTDMDGNPTASYKEKITSIVSAEDDAIVNEDGKIGVPVLKTKGDSNGGGGSNVHTAPSVNVSSGANTRAKTMGTNGGGSSGGGGSGSAKNNKPAKVKPTKKKEKNDEVERYHEINEVLQDLADELDDIGELKDEAFGADKLRAMDKEIAKIEQTIKAHKKYQDQIENNLSLDRAEAEQYGAIFDADNRISNYEALQEQWMNEWNAQAAAFDAREQDIENRLAAAKNAEDEATQEALEDEKDALSDERDAADEAYEKKRKALEQYEETLNLDEEAKRELEDYLRQIRQLNYEKLEYKLEIRLELNERDLADIEYRLSLISEKDWTKTAERIGVLTGGIKSYRISLLEISDSLEELKQQYINGEINQSNYFEGLTERAEKAQGYVQDFKDTMSQVTDELINGIDIFTDKIDYLYECLDRRNQFADFYKDISTIINGSTDYEILNKMVDAQRAISQTRMNSALQERELLIDEQQKLYKRREKVTSQDEADEIDKALKHINARIADTNTEIQSSIQALAEYAQEKFENAIENIAQQWQEDVFGEDLSWVLEDIDLKNRTQEELLTTTNKVYETDKLIRQAEKDIAATTNKRAKQAYEEYINKAKQKQEQNELTQLELDLLTAEYEITKAQIALEEAQDAKSQVRLTRDSEGNFGYVYTADQDKIGDAEQALADAQNNYYNIALEGAKSSSEQIYQLEQEWLEKVKEINLDATLSESEKWQKVNEITDYYRTLISQQQDKFYTAKAAVEESSYEHELDYNLRSIDDAEYWFDTQDEILDDMRDAVDEYGDDVEDITDRVEDAYGDQTDAVGYVTSATETYQDCLDSVLYDMEYSLPKSIQTALQSWREYAEELEIVKALTEDITGQTHDDYLKEVYKDDYAAQISRIIETIGVEAAMQDSDVQKLLAYRWEKMGGVDNNNYQEIIDQYGENSEEGRLATVLRNYKIQKTDWMELIQDDIINGRDYSWKEQVRDEKIGVSGQTAKDIEQWLMDNDWMETLTEHISNGGSVVAAQVIEALRNDKQIKLGLEPSTEKDLQDWLVSESPDFMEIGKQMLKDINYNWDACLTAITNLSAWQNTKAVAQGDTDSNAMKDFWDWYAANKPATSTTASTDNGVSSDLGYISRYFEVGEGGNGGMISSVKGDYGGTSYGLPMYATNTGNAKEFANWLISAYPDMGSALQGLSPGTQDFNEAWKEIYSKYGSDFESAQMEYAWNKMVTPWISAAKEKTGIDFSRSRALQELAYSTAVQYGTYSASYVLPSGLSSSMSDQEIIEAVYSYKAANVSRNFRDSSSSVQSAISNRIPREKQMLLDLAATEVANQQEEQSSETLAYPLGSTYTITSDYGYRKHPVTGENNSFHGGIDLGVPEGTPVLASASGTVSAVNWSTQYNGNCIKIDHGNGLTTGYLHLSNVEVAEGDKVTQGQEIAKSGNTGRSTGAHLDFRVWSNGEAVDPKNYIQFDTGGYTGDWGPEGKLAVLHEKEIVLNSDDTENILASVSIIREISQALDKSALWASLGMANLSANYIGSTADQVLQQQVEIHADFPNVQDHNEIEMAIDNLINAASQYAYRG